MQQIEDWFFKTFNITEVKTTYILAAISLIVVFIYIFRNKNYRRSYLEYVLFFFPIVALNVTRETYGALTVFDIVTYIVMLMEYKDILTIYKKNVLYLVLYVVFICLLLLGSFYYEFRLNSTLFTVSFIPIIFYVKLLVDECVINPAFVKKVLLGFQFSFLISIIFMVLQIIIGTQVTMYTELNYNVLNDAGGIRYPGMFPDSQNHSLFLAMSSFLLLLNLDNPNKPKLKNILFFIAAVVGIFFTGGRSGFFGFCCGLVFLILFLKPRFKLYAFVIIALGLMALPFFMKSVPLFNRMDDVNESYLFRHRIWSQAYDIFKKHPYLGIGIGNYGDYVKIYSQDQYLRQAEENILWLNQPENGYLKMLVEYGILSFSIAMLFVIVPVLKGVYVHFFKRRMDEIFYYIAPLISWAIAFSTVFSFGDKRILIFVATIIGLIVSKTNTLKTCQN
jgi:O-antigen ligase